MRQAAAEEKARKEAEMQREKEEKEKEKKEAEARAAEAKRVESEEKARKEAEMRQAAAEEKARKEAEIKREQDEKEKRRKEEQKVIDEERKKREEEARMKEIEENKQREKKKMEAKRDNFSSSVIPSSAIIEGEVTLVRRSGTDHASLQLKYAKIAQMNGAKRLYILPYGGSSPELIVDLPAQTSFENIPNISLPGRSISITSQVTLFFFAFNSPKCRT